MTAILRSTVKPSFIMPGSLLASGCKPAARYFGQPLQPETAGAKQLGFTHQPNTWQNN